jgi:iron(III) transport system ATP-binding protein
VNALEVEGVTIRFGRTEVLTGVDLHVPARSITSVLGPSGSGKTTLLRVIAGFERAQAGRVRVGDQLVDGPGRQLPPERRSIGYVAQDGALFPHLTVAANIGFGLRRSPHRRRRVDELLELVGLGDLRHRYPHELSGGQQQRVALARALARAPALILLDEPFSSLDAALRASVRTEIAAMLRAAETTVVMVTHDQVEALSLGDQIAVLRQGRIAQVGSPRDLYTNPVDPEMARFLGEANLIDAEIEDGAAITALGRLDIRATAPGQHRGRARVLIRPEQIDLTPGDRRAESVGDGFGSALVGLVGVVTNLSYQGHDCVVTVRAQSPGPIELIRVRQRGDLSVEIGAVVTLTAFGTVASWPT